MPITFSAPPTKITLSGDFKMKPENEKLSEMNKFEQMILTLLRMGGGGRIGGRGGGESGKKSPLPVFPLKLLQM